MKRTKFRKFKLGALFLIIGLFFVLLTGCDTLFPGDTRKNENVNLAFEQTQINFATGDIKTSVTKDFQVPLSVQGVPIQWISSNEDVISIVAGKVTVNRQNEDVTVYITAKIGSGGYYQYKTFEVIVKGDADVEPEEIRHRVRFIVDGIVYGEVQMVLDGGTAIPPRNPFKENHRFMGWFLDESFAREYDREAPITKDTDIYGKFELGGYQVRFFVDGVLYGIPQYVKFGDAAILPPDPQVDGKYFMGWDRQSFVIFDNVDIHAILTPIPTYVVKFIDHNGIVLKQQQVYENTAATAPANPTRTGYTFAGWDQDFNSVTSNLDVNATYTINSYTATFKVVGSDDVVKTYNFGAAVTAPEVEDKEGHSFSWDDPVPTTMPAQNVVINGSYKLNRYTVTYKVANQQDVVETYNYGAEITIKANLVKAGYSFAWDPNSLPATMPAENIEVIGTFTPIEYTITYHLDGGSHTGNPATYNIETPTITLKPASKPGYTFDGWFVGNTEVTEIRLGSTGNKEFTAKFTEKPDAQKFTVTLVGEGLSSETDPLTNVTEGTEIVIKVTVPEGKELDKFTVDGVEKALDPNNQYTLVVTANHVVAVTFKLIPTGTEAIIKYTGAVTSNMTGNNDAELLNVSADLFNIVGNQNNASNNVGLNQDGNIRLYTDSSKAGNGAALSVEILNNKKIISVEFVLMAGSNMVDGNNPSAKIMLGDQEVIVTGVANLQNTTLSYNELDITKFSIQNTQVGGNKNTQIWISQIIVRYEDGEPLEMVNVTFDLNGGTLAGFNTVHQVEKGKAIADPNVEPLKEGFAFVEWRLENDDDGYNFAQPVIKDIKLVAHYVEGEPTYTVTLGNGLSSTTDPLTGLAAGTEVVITVTVPEGRNLDKVTVDGNAVEIVDGKFTLTVSKNHNVVMVLLPTIAEVREQVTGAISFVGIVTRVSGNYMQVADATGAITLYKPTHSAVVGDKVKVTGNRGAYYGLQQISAGVVTVLSQNHDIPVFAIDTLENINDRQSQHISITGLTPVSISEDNRNLTVNLGELEIIIRSNADSGDVFNKVKLALEAKSINLIGAFVDWYSSKAQFLIENVNQIELIEFTDAEKAAEIIASFDFDGKQYNTGSTVELPQTFHKYSPVITWTYDPEAAVADGKWVAVDGQETTVTIKAKVVVGELTDTTYQATITVLAEEQTYTVTLSEGLSSETDPLTGLLANTKVVVSVTIPDGYEVDTFKVDGIDAVFTDEGTYTLTVSKNHNLVVTFKPILTGNEAIIKHIGTTSGNVGTENIAEVMNQSADLFDIRAIQGSAGNNIRMQANAEMRVYGARDNGDGNTLSVEILGNKKIISVEFVLVAGSNMVDGNNPSAKIMLGDQEVIVTGAANLQDTTLSYYNLNIKKFSIQNTQLNPEGAANVQIRIAQIIVRYEDDTTPPVETVNVTFDLNGGELAGFVLVHEVEKGKAIADPNVEPLKEGFTFVEWRLEGENDGYDFTQPVIKDIKLVAHYVEGEPTYTVTLGNGLSSTTDPLTGLAAGTEVVIMVTVPEGRDLDKVTVDGNAVEIVDGKFTLTVSKNHNVAMVLLPTIAEVREQVTGAVAFVGIVTRIVGDNMQVADATGAITLYKSTHSAVVGDKVKVTGNRGAYYGLQQISAGVVTVLSQNHDIPVFAIDTLENINDRQSQHISISGLVPISLGGNDRNLTVKLGDLQIVVRSNADSGDVFNKVKLALEAKSINLTGVFVDWYSNKAQFLIENVDQIELIEFTDAEKAAEIIASFDFDGKQYNTGSTVDLPQTFHKYSPVITWTYDPEAAVADGKWVAVDGQETTVTIKAKVVVGELTDTTYQATITVLAEEQTYTVTLSEGLSSETDPLTGLLANTKVVVSVTIPEGYEVDTFKVDGIDAVFTDEGTYTLTVSKNHNLVVTFKPILTGTEATIQYLGETSGNAPTGNQAESFGQSAELFDIQCIRGGASGNIYLHNTGHIRLYQHKSSGNGNTFSVEILGGRKILSVQFVLIAGDKMVDANNPSAKIMLGDQEIIIEGADNLQNITHTYVGLDITKFSIQNTQSGGDANTQIRIGQVIVRYEDGEPAETVNVTFDLAGGSLTGLVSPVAVVIGQKVANPGSPTKEGHTFVEWQLNGSAYDFDLAVNVAITLIAHYEETPAPETVNVTFDLAGGSLTGLVSPVAVVVGQKVANPGSPTKEGHTFVEWQLNGTAYDFDLAVNAAITLIAHYEETPAPETVNVTFDLAGGSLTGLVSPVAVVVGQKVANPGSPTKEGHTFVEWQLNGSAYDFDLAVNVAITLIAHYEETPAPETVNVTFDLAGGSLTGLVSPVAVVIGQKVANPGSPTKEGHTFVEWQLNGSAYDFDLAVNAAITLIAHYEELVLIEGTHTVSIKYIGDAITTGIPDGSINSYLTIVQTTGNGPINVVFDGSGATTKSIFNNSSNQIRLYSGGKLNLTVPGAVITKIEWTSSRNNGIKVNDGEIIETQNSAVEFADGVDAVSILASGAQFRIDELIVTYRVGEPTPPETVNVTFDLAGGSLTGLTSPVAVVKGQKVANPGNPTKENYHFIEWRLNGNKYNFDTPVEEAITLVAYYEINQHTVTFKVDGNPYGEAVTVDHGNTVSAPTTAPTKDGYTFKEWQLNGEKYSFDTPVVADLELVAAFDILPLEVTVSGSMTSVLEFTFNQEVEFTKETTDKQAFLEALFSSDADYSLINFNEVGINYSNKVLTLSFGVCIMSNANLKAVDYESPTGDGNGIIRYYFDFINTGVKSVAHGGTNTSEVERYRLKILVTCGEDGLPNYDGMVFAVMYNVADYNTDLPTDPIIKYDVKFMVGDSQHGPIQKVNHNALVEIPEENPVKAGYTFKEWQLNGTAYNFNTQVKGALELKAAFDEVPLTTTASGSTTNQLILTFNQEVEFTEEITNKQAFLESLFVSNTDYTYVDFDKIDITYANKVLTITFSDNVISNVALKAFDFDNPTGDGNGILRLHYDFINAGVKSAAHDGINTSEVERQRLKLFVPFVDGAANFTADVQALVYNVADWNADKVNDPVVKYDVKFMVGDSQHGPIQKVNHNALVEAPTENPIKAGYTFKEWQLNGTAYNFNAQVKGALELKAAFDELPLTTTASGSTTNQLILTFNQEVEFTEEITNKQAFLESLFTSNTNYEYVDFSKVDIVYANKVLTITFSDNVISNNVLKAIDFDSPTGDGNGIIRLHYDFINAGVKSAAHGGTNTSEVERQRLKLFVPFVDGAAVFTADVQALVYNIADWNADKVNDPVVTYEVKFVVNSVVDSTQQVNHNAVATQPDDPVVDDYIFKGWKVGTSAYNFAAKVTSNLEIVAEMKSTIASVSTLAELQAALADAEIRTINLTDNIVINDAADKLVLSRNDVVINGGGNTITANDPAGWGPSQGFYILQVFKATGITINNVIFDGGDAALLVNGSEVVVNNITIINAEFGGIEVSQGSGVTTIPKLTVTGDLTYSSDYLPAIWIDKKQTNDGWVVQTGLTEIVYEFKNQLWFVDETFTGAEVVVKTEAALHAALAHNHVKGIHLSKDIALETQALLSRSNVTINGHGFTLSITSPGGWQGDYVLQVYEATGVVLENLKLSGGDAGLLVNGSTVTANNLTVTNYESGGIEVSKGSEVVLDPELTITGTFTYALIQRPPIWIDKKHTNDGWVIQTGLTEATYITADKDQLFFVPAAYTKTVTFDYTGYPAVTVVANSRVLRPAVDPILENHIFVEWQKDGAAYDFTSNVIENITLTAKMKSTIASVSTLAELQAALADADIRTINLTDDIVINNADDVLVLSRNNVTINGNGHTIQGNDPAGWGPTKGFYILQVFKATGITINNVIFDGGDAALLVNGSEVVVNNITIINAEFGGIEVSQGSGVTTIPKLTVTGDLTHSHPNLPTIWIDKKQTNDGWVVQTGLTERPFVAKNQLWFVGTDFEGILAPVSNKTQLKQALAADVDIIKFVADITLDNVEGDRKLPLRNNLIIDGNGHSIIQPITSDWEQAYAFQAYKVTGVIIKNLTFNGGDAAVLVNGSEVTVHNITLSNNEYGGIEVSQGIGVTNIPKLTVTGTLDYSGLTNVPPIWIDGKTTNDGWVVQNLGLVEATYVKGTKTQLLFVPVAYTNTVTFNYDGYPVVRVIHDSKVLKPAVDPTKPGHQFVEWQLSGTTYDFNQMVTSNITLDPVFMTVLTITASGSTTNVLTLDFSEDVYFTDGTNTIDISDIATNNTTKRTLLTNIFQFEATVNFDLLDFDKITIAYDDTLFKLIITFADGVMDSMVFKNIDYVNGNGDGILRFKFDLVNAKIKSVEHNTISASNITEYRLKLYVPWLSAEAKADYTSPVLSKVYNKADFQNDKLNDPVYQHEVKFVVNGATTSTVNIVHNQTVAQPDDPVVDDYIFKGWKVGASAYNFAAKVTSNLEIVAEMKSTIASVSTLAELQVALADAEIRTINLTDDIVINNADDVLVLSRNDVTINGNGHTIQGNDPAGWGPTKGFYILQVFKATGITINNVIFDGGDAALLVNGSEVVVNNITIINAEFGGIEVSQGSGVTTIPKLTVTGDLTYSSNYLPAIWIDKRQVNDGWVVQTGLTEIVYEFKNQLWFVDETFTGAEVVVKTEAALHAALAHNHVKGIHLSKDIALETQALLSRSNVTINGHGYTLSITSPGGWQGDYVLQVYESTGVVLENLKLSGGDAGLLVNGSTVTANDLTVTNYESGGIEVSKGSEVVLDPELTITGTFTYALIQRPPIWIDKKHTNDGWVVQTGLTEATYIIEGKDQLFFVPVAYTRTVTFDYAGYDPVIVVANSRVLKPAVDPVKEGHDFVEWQKGEATYDFTSNVTENITLTAKFNIN